MASTVKVQTYLEKHKIGALFEELMGKVISDQPDEPIAYLVRILERKGNRLGVSNLRKSTGDIEKSSEKRGYEKPWQTQVKKKPIKKSDSNLNQRPEFDARPVRSSTTFDELFDAKSGKVSSKTREKSAKSQSVTWNEEEDEFLYKSYGYRGPRRKTETDDPLAGELCLAKSKDDDDDDNDTVNKQTSKNISHGRYGGRKADALSHRKELEKMVLEHKEKQRQQDSGIEDDKDLDDAPDEVELAENLDDLKNEGVNIKMKTASNKVKNIGKAIKFMKTRVQDQRSNPAAGVRVSICATCAKVMTGGTPSEPARGTKYGELPEFDYDTDREFPESSRPQSALSKTATNVSPGPSDDEFESVSQVTGPRRPVWQENENVKTPRKGTHMFASLSSPSKGKPMISPDLPASGHHVGLSKTGSISAKSEDFQKSRAGLVGHDAFNKTWSPERGGLADSSENPTAAKESAEKAVEPIIEESEPVSNKDEAAISLAEASGFGQSSQGWKIPPTDYDTDASDAYPIRGRGYYSNQQF